MKRLLLWSLIVLGALNAILLTSNAYLLDALKNLRDSRTLAALETISRERGRFAIERARLVGHTARLEECIRALGERGANRNPGTAPASEATSFDLQSRYPELDLSRRPVPSEIPGMEPAEIEEVLHRRKSLPPGLNSGLLLSGDVDHVLANSAWNPQGRNLTQAERMELSQLLGNYRYYARLSPVERYETYVKPEVPRLRAAEAYVEYAKGEGPPIAEGARISHAEPSERPGTKRIYYFHPDDYPDLAHHERVERERGLETFVRIYELINGAK
jgi:hypothetical protein